MGRERESGFCGDSVFRFGLSWKGFGIRAFVGKDSGFRGEDFIWAFVRRGMGWRGEGVGERTGGRDGGGGGGGWKGEVEVEGWRRGGGGSADLKRA